MRSPGRMAAEGGRARPLKKFCYRCGALEGEAGPLIQGLCQDCFTAENRLLSAPAEVEVVFCKGCGAHMLDKKWVGPENGRSISDAIHEAVLRSLRIAHLTDAGLEFAPPRGAGWAELTVEPRLGPGEPLAEVRARGKVHRLQLRPSEESARIKVKLKGATCDVCRLKSSGYYEAVLQLRGEPGLGRLAEARELLKEFAREVGARERGALVARVDEGPWGADFYVSSISLARRMGALLKSKFGARVSETAKLVGADRGGRRKFRVTLAARL